MLCRDLQASECVRYAPSFILLSDAVTVRPYGIIRYAALDRGVKAAVARVTDGNPPHAMVYAWLNWSMHLARAPGRQLELLERARESLLSLGPCAARVRSRQRSRRRQAEPQPAGSRCRGRHGAVALQAERELLKDGSRSGLNKFLHSEHLRGL